MTTTNVRKTFNCLGFVLEALFFLVVGYSKNSTISIIALICGVTCSALSVSGYNVNHLDIAPRYASILMGISNGIGMLSGVICPIFTERMTRSENSKSILHSEWFYVFLIASCINIFGSLFYAVFASGELQSWADDYKV